MTPASHLPPRLVTHRNCIDGSGCAVVFRLAFPGHPVLFVGADEAGGVPDRDRFQTFFADVHPGDHRPWEVVLDHHASNMERACERLGHEVMDMGRCGCRILLDYLVEEGQIRPGLGLRDMIDFIDDYDRYVRSYPYSSDLARFHQFVGQERFVSLALNGPGVPSEMHAVSYTLAENERRYTEDVVRVSWVDHWCLPDRPAPAQLACAYAEESNCVADALFERYPDIDFAVVLNVLHRKVSIRSRDDANDCVTLARAMSGVGGGHRRAAGFHMTDGQLERSRRIL